MIGEHSSRPFKKIIKKDDDTWEDGWEVIGKSDGVKTASDANDLSQLYKKTRKASDI